MAALRTRRDVTTLTEREVETLRRAFQRLMAPQGEEPSRYWHIASKHGDPGSKYCTHNNPLFPMWHRAYLLELEDALREVDEDFEALPYFDSTSGRFPTVFSEETCTIDNKVVPNPLHHYVHERSISIYGDDYPEVRSGDRTRRFPHGNVQSRRAADADLDERERELRRALEREFSSSELHQLIEEQFKSISEDLKRALDRAMRVRTYIEMSNRVVHADSVEAPHDMVHVALGARIGVRSRLMDRNERVLRRFRLDNYGEMSLVELSSFDPIFFFHHCNVDRWVHSWQILHPNQGVTWDPEDPSAFVRESTVPELRDGVKVDDTTPLYPFNQYTSRSCASIVSLGYTYDSPVLSGFSPTISLLALPNSRPSSSLSMAGAWNRKTRVAVNLNHVNPNLLSGSFCVVVEALDGTVLDQQAVFGRLKKEGCENCEMKSDLTLKFTFDTDSAADENEVLSGLKIQVIHSGDRKDLKDVFGADVSITASFEENI